MVWGVLVIAAATAILFSSFFTETWAREAHAAAECGRARDLPPHTYRSLLAKGRWLRAITRWLRVCAVLYLLIGLLADWLCLNLIR
ncbi:hypothetical protein [Nocardia miyunensis]|uniref:hypothetical protein n=1 Tax=Nocardia miyunensis TaxID=282684 RepID=UPI000836AAE6|nr:hypothetical protein [Nocardia miyunensis]